MLCQQNIMSTECYANRMLCQQNVMLTECYVNRMLCQQKVMPTEGYPKLSFELQFMRWFECLKPTVGGLNVGAVVGLTAAGSGWTECRVQ